jgi:hypothetical protein
VINDVGAASPSAQSAQARLVPGCTIVYSAPDLVVYRVP